MTLQNNRGKRGARSKRKAQIFYFSCQKYQSNIVSNVMKMFQRLYIARLCCLSSYFAKHDVATKSKQPTWYQVISRQQQKNANFHKYHDEISNWTITMTKTAWYAVICYLWRKFPVNLKEKVIWVPHQFRLISSFGKKKIECKNAKYTISELLEFFLYVWNTSRELRKSQNLRILTWER